jgi:hypothetical protein
LSGYGNEHIRHDHEQGFPPQGRASRCAHCSACRCAAGCTAGRTDRAPVSTNGASAVVDVGAVLSEMASMKDGGGNYQSSIVDLLKLLDLDSSLTARKELADELNVHASADGSAEQNIALHKAVMQKLADNGGIIPDSLRN